MSVINLRGYAIVKPGGEVNGIVVANSPNEALENCYLFRPARWTERREKGWRMVPVLITESDHE